MILIPAGVFQMGDDGLRGNQRHQVSLGVFLIGKAPVTVGQFKGYCFDKGINFSNFGETEWGWMDDHPMVNVTWQQARDFCKWAGGDLPTEAQWEKAARGTDARKYPWGPNWDGTRLQFDSDMTDSVRAHASGASPYGCLDMAGNVWQWCSDWYASAGSEKKDFRERVLKGGSWACSNPVLVEAASRLGEDPAYRDVSIGFRLASPP